MKQMRSDNAPIDDLGRYETLSQRVDFIGFAASIFGVLVV
jgi:hypothetical protein